MKEAGYDLIVQDGSDYEMGDYIAVLGRNAVVVNVREKYRELSNSTPEEVQRFIENIPIFDNFLDMDQCDKDTVVLLGDYLNAHKDDVIAALDEGRFPIPTLRKPATWYADFVWDNF